MGDEGAAGREGEGVKAGARRDFRVFYPQPQPPFWSPPFPPPLFRRRPAGAIRPGWPAGQISGERERGEGGGGTGEWWAGGRMGGRAAGGLAGGWVVGG